MDNAEDKISLVPWKLYLALTAESLLTFYLATFCLGMYFTHGGFKFIYTSIFLLLLYVFMIFVCAKRILQKLPIAAIMLIIPIAPLLALIIVVTLIPILEKFQ